MKLSSTQKEIVYGLVLGDGYLQPTGAHNARLRVEHSEKQVAYAQWIFQQLENLFTRKPQRLSRIHPKTQRTYSYVRLQSHSSPWFGELRSVAYSNKTKNIASLVENYLHTARTLAVWYMDDGYYYAKDKSAHIYLPKISVDELQRIVKVFVGRFGITPHTYCRPDRASCHLTFNGAHLKKFVQLIQPHVIVSMRYKIPLDPVTTESEN
jgi:hypothetical protein